MTAARNPLPVAIAGGGIGGLACALALARRGFRALLLEQARAFGEVGVGLQVAPNALAVLDALGVGAAAKKNALLIERLLMKDAITGETVADIACGDRFCERFGNPYAVAHRAHIHGALLDACRGHDLIELRTGSRVDGFELDGSRVAVALQLATMVLQVLGCRAQSGEDRLVARVQSVDEADATRSTQRVRAPDDARYARRRRSVDHHGAYARVVSRLARPRDERARLCAVLGDLQAERLVPRECVEVPRRHRVRLRAERRDARCRVGLRGVRRRAHREKAHHGEQGGSECRARRSEQLRGDADTLA